MSMRADYKCKKCQEITEYIKPYGEEFPKVIRCLKCQQLSAFRLYGVPEIEVAEGKLGNSKTGYKNNVFYHNSMVAPKASKNSRE